MATQKQEFVFRASFLKKLIAVSEEQPTAVQLYLKILVNANTHQRKVNDIVVERGQIALRFKTEKVFFNTSGKRFRKDRFYLVQKGLIETNRLHGMTILTVCNYDVIVKPLMSGL